MNRRMEFCDQKTSFLAHPLCVQAYINAISQNTLLFPRVYLYFCYISTFPDILNLLPPFFKGASQPKACDV